MIDFNTFWKIWAQIRGTDQGDDLTTALKALAQSEQATSTNLWNNVIKQPAYNSQDFLRLSNLFIDWYASHRTMISTQAQLTDPFSRSNDELDEMFRSFGYNFSTDIKGPSSDPLTLKVNFFLDLVNLYKIKGTPQALLEVLQYYGINDLDIYEFFLEKETQNDLTFRGNVIAGTTGDTSPVFFPFGLLTLNDPHWRYTENQILTLDQINKINLPSMSPYLGIKPIFDINSTSTAILSRTVQDQHDIFDGGGTLTEDATVTLVGRKTSLLGLYLASVYYFNLQFTAGFDSGNNFVCYDGTNSSVTSIETEFSNITQSRITARDQIPIRLAQYYDLFTRVDSSNFLQNRSDAGNILDSVDATLKSELASSGESNLAILESLLKDLGDWVKINIGFGFVNIALIVSGLSLVFDDLRNAINFFKPYRARIIPIEAIQTKNRLFGTFLIEDQDFAFDQEQIIHDFLTGNSAPCCDGTSTICTESSDADQYYSRDTYDCNSYHDIGMVTDIPRGIEITEEILFTDSLRCPIDSTGFVTSEVLGTPQRSASNSKTLNDGDTTVSVLFTDQTNVDYAVNVDLINNGDASPTTYDYLITSKRNTGFTVKFSSAIDSDNYVISYDTGVSKTSGTESLLLGATEKSVLYPAAIINPNYAVAVNLTNTLDSNPTFFSHSIVEKNASGFKVQFSSPIDSTNYSLDWIVYDTTASGVTSLANGVDSATITLPFAQSTNEYAVIVELSNTVDSSSSFFTYIVTDKTTTQFTVQLSAPTDSPNYKLFWYVIAQQLELNELEYYQSGSFRDYDNESKFDCTHGFDLVQVSLLANGFYILKEDGGYLLNEDGGRFFLEESPV